MNSSKVAKDTINTQADLVRIDAALLQQVRLHVVQLVPRKTLKQFVEDAVLLALALPVRRAR